jgi:hypothetical protein
MTSQANRLVVLVILAASPAVAMGCGSPPPDVTPPPEHPGQAATTVAAATTAAPVATPATAETPRPASPFVLLHKADSQLDFIGLDDSVLLQKKGALLQLDGDQVRDVTAVLDGLGDPKEGLSFRKSSFVLWSMKGSLAGDLQAHISAGEDPSNVGRIFLRRGGKWRERKFGDTYMRAARGESWLSDTDLANGARLYERFDIRTKSVVLEVDGPKPAAMPELTRGKKGCGARMVFHSLLSELADGTIVGAGQACTGKEDRLASALGRTQATKGPLAVEMWAKGEAIPRFHVLPGDHAAGGSGGPRFSLFGDAKDLWIASQIDNKGDEFGAPYLAHFDGSAWKDVTPSCELPISHLVRGAHTFVFCGDRGYRRDGDAWTKLDVGFHGAHKIFDAVAMVGQGSVAGLHDGALHWMAATGSSFERFEAPEIDGTKLRLNSLFVTGKGEVLVAAAFRKPGNEYALLRFDAPK